MYELPSQGPEGTTNRPLLYCKTTNRFWILNSRPAFIIESYWILKHGKLFQIIPNGNAICKYKSIFDIRQICIYACEMSNYWSRCLYSKITVKVSCRLLSLCNIMSIEWKWKYPALLTHIYRLIKKWIIWKWRRPNHHALIQIKRRSTVTT